MNIFKPLIFFALVALAPFALLAHEEPVKTMEERAEKEASRARILNAGIKRIVTCEYAVAEGKETGEKNVAMVREFDKSGNLVSMEVHEDPRAATRVEYFYDKGPGISEERTFRPSDGLVDRDVFEYDGGDRVLSGKTYDPRGEVAETFRYVYDPGRKKITFVKYKAGPQPDYTVEYLYARDYDKEGPVETVKRDGKGNIVLKVKEERDTGGRRTDKILFDRELKETKRFHYDYDGEGKLSKVTTAAPDPTGTSIEAYAYDEKGIRREQRVSHADGRLVGVIRHELEYFPDRQAGDGPGKGGQHFGGEMRIREATPIAELSAHPEKWYNRDVRIEGIIASACTQEGCFIEVVPESGPGEGILVNFPDPDLKFPTGCAGRRAAVEGMFYQKIYPASRVAHWAHHSFREGMAVPEFALIKRIAATAADISAERIEIPPPGAIVKGETKKVDLSMMEFETEGFGTGRKTLGPGELTPEHSTGSVREMIFCLEGELAIRLGGAESHVVRTGEMSFIPPYTKHELRNDGNTRCTYVFVFAKAPEEAVQKEKHDH
jgi:quercetin dioxygenase-like cupin family protein